jgi:glycogen(starch) synthase
LRTLAEKLTSRLNEWKTDLWNLAGIPSPPNDHETNEAIVFGYIVAWFLGEVSQLSLLEGH